MSMQYDPLSRTSVALRRSIISLVVATVLTVAFAYLLAPSRAADPKLWPAIVFASLRYTASATTWLFDHPTWRAFSTLQFRPFLHGVTVSLGMVAMMVSGLVLWLSSTNRKDYGDSEYANKGDLRRLNLMGKLGPVLGQFGSRLLMPDALRSTLVIAPTRAGKTRGIVIPTILMYKGSKVIIDPKRELIEKTADAERRAGRAVHVIDWTDPSSPSGWNPLGLDLPSNEIGLERSLERMAAMIYPHQGNGDPHWKDSARRNFVALAMFQVLEARRQGITPKVADIYSLIAKCAQENPTGDEEGDPVADALKALAKEAMVNGFPSRVSDDLLLFANTHYRERSSHISTLITGLQIWRNAAVAAVTSHSSFTWSELRQRPTTIYIAFPQADAKAFGPLTAIFLESLFAWGIDTAPGKGEQPILVVGEEFASLPEIPLLFDVLAKGNGMGLHMMVILQEIAQFESIYKQTGVSQLTTNCSYIIAFNTVNRQTQETLSKLVGHTTREKKSKSRNANQLFAGNANYSLEGVPLIRPEQWGAIPFGKHILLAQPDFTRPVFCNTPFWDKQRQLRRRMAA
jgi:type IV secretion system protein VirD4